MSRTMPDAAGGPDVAADAAEAGAFVSAPRKAHRSELLLAWQAMAQDRLALAGIIIFLAAVLLALLAAWLSPYDPNVASQTASRLAPPLTPGHLLGTDGQGRDILSRLIWGGRVSIPIALAPIVTSSAVGLVLGLIAGYFGGIVSALIMRSLDVVFAFPGVLLAVVVAANPRSPTPYSTASFTTPTASTSRASPAQAQQAAAARRRQRQMRVPRPGGRGPGAPPAPSTAAIPGRAAAC